MAERAAQCVGVANRTDHGAIEASALPESAEGGVVDRSVYPDLRRGETLGGAVDLTGPCGLSGREPCEPIRVVVARRPVIRFSASQE
eukprot:3006543-Alexandrium_andersonii.AAC.1